MIQAITELNWIDVDDSDADTSALKIISEPDFVGKGWRWGWLRQNLEIQTEDSPFPSFPFSHHLWHYQQHPSTASIDSQTNAYRNKQ